MPELDGVAGKMGDVSGKMGDVSGKMGDVSGVMGKMGDVSGAPRTLADVHRLFLQDRQAETISTLQMKINRLENEILAIAQWLDNRLSIVEERVLSGNLEARVKLLETDVLRLKSVKPPTPSPMT
jgi:hypothetical protein